jgi:hypothetical protein
MGLCNDGKRQEETFLTYPTHFLTITHPLTHSLTLFLTPLGGNCAPLTHRPLKTHLNALWAPPMSSAPLLAYHLTLTWSHAPPHPSTPSIHVKTLKWCAPLLEILSLAWFLTLGSHPRGVSLPLQAIKRASPHSFPHQSLS